MTIGIDASRTVKKLRTGTEQYSWQILKALAKIETPHQFILYLPKDPKEIKHLKKDELEFWENLPQNFLIKVIKFRKFWTLIGLSIEMLKNPPDVLFVPAHALPIILPKKTVITLHGTEYIDYKEAYSKFDRWYLNYTTKKALQEASKVITVSHTAKKKFFRYYPSSDPSKVVTIYHGVECVDPELENGQVNEKPYFLFIGSLVKWKNIDFLIKAFQTLARKYDLIIVGNKTGYYQELKNICHKLNIEKEVQFLGYVSEKKKWQLLTAAEALVEPSLSGGFGMTIYEAMCAETPVCLADTELFREVAGNAGWYFNIKSEVSLTDSLNKIINNNDLRNKKTSLGKELIRKADWTQVAKDTLKVITEA
ncbi:MAG: glycosyltransferase family 1 protein [bacterium]